MQNRASQRAVGIFPDPSKIKNHIGGINVDGILFSNQKVEVIKEALRSSLGCDTAKGPKTKKFRSCDVDGVIPNAQICPIFWGTAWNNGTHPSVQTVWNSLNNIVNSPYLSFLSQYLDPPVNRPIYTGPNDTATLLPPVVYTDRQSAQAAYGKGLREDNDQFGQSRWLPADPPSPLSKQDLWLAVRIAIGWLSHLPSGHDPFIGPRIIYIVFTPSGVTNDESSPGYHAMNDLTVSHPRPLGSVGNPHIPWAVVGAVREKPTLDDVTEVFSHELVEAVSHPYTNLDGGVVLWPDVQAAEKIDSRETELGDYAQMHDPFPFRRIRSGESVSSYWSDWHGEGVVPERYPYYHEFGPEDASCAEPTLVHRYHNELEHWFEVHRGDPSPVLNAVRRLDTTVMSGMNLVPRNQLERLAIVEAAARIALK